MKDLCGFLTWETKNTGRDGREGDGCDLQFLCQQETTANSSTQLEFLIPFSPYGTGGVDDIAAGQLPRGSICRMGMADWTVLGYPVIAFCLNAAAACQGDSACHSPAMLQVLVGGVDDRIYFFMGDVAFDHMKRMVLVERKFQMLRHTSILMDKT